MVRIRIEQRLAITRDAFEATLELDNGESDRLERIRVVVIIRDTTTHESAEYKFALGRKHTCGANLI